MVTDMSCIPRAVAVSLADPAFSRSAMQRILSLATGTGTGAPDIMQCDPEAQSKAMIEAI